MSMISTQLGRAVLGGPESSPDEQRASPGEDGGYDDLIEAIDRMIEEVESEARTAGRPRRGS